MRCGGACFGENPNLARSGQTSIRSQVKAASSGACAGGFLPKRVGQNPRQKLSVWFQLLLLAVRSRAEAEPNTGYTSPITAQPNGSYTAHSGPHTRTLLCLCRRGRALAPCSIALAASSSAWPPPSPGVAVLTCCSSPCPLGELLTSCIF